MSEFIIEGGAPLSGAYRTQGMKNAALPILAATLLTEEECIIKNIPRIVDVRHMLEILESVGALINWKNEHTLSIQTPTLLTTTLEYTLAKSVRTSVLCVGPILARIGHIELPEPGGCNIGNRPLDTHFEAIQALGATIQSEKNGYYDIFGEKLQSGVVVMKEKSVTATENVMMLASRLSGETIIKNAAAEPHIVSLAAFLRDMGATVSGEGTHEIAITGSKSPSGATGEIIPDQLEVGTIAVLGALCGGTIEISPVVHEDMRAIARKLKEAGVRFEEKENAWVVHRSIDTLRPFSIETAPHPGFPTDLQATFGVLATQAKGVSTIYDPMFENRLGYINELITMGADASVIDAHHAKITGPTPLHGRQIRSLDIRAGATLLIAALAAEGTSVIHDAQIIDRGYECIDERIRSLGGNIRRAA